MLRGEFSLLLFLVLIWTHHHMPRLHEPTIHQKSTSYTCACESQPVDVQSPPAIRGATTAWYHSQDLLYFPCLFSSLPYSQKTHLELLQKHWVQKAMAVLLQLIPGQIRKGCRYSLGREEIRKILKKLFRITC